jgi:zinc protease
MGFKKAFISLLCWMPLEAQQQAQNSSFELSNGLKVVVLTNTRVPVVYHSIWYKVGSTNDPVLKSGMAHYLEHMMFKSTKNHSSGAYLNIVTELGGKYNATTSFDRTNYYVTVDKKYLEKIMELEADRMENLTIDPKEALAERSVVIEERLMVRDNPPSARLSEMGLSHYYLHHPYRIPVIGWKHEMETYTREDALAFYKKFYSPRNAILLLSGDITVDEAKALAQKYYGSIPAAPITDSPQFKEPSNHNITASLVLKDKDFGTPNLGIWFKGLSWKDDLKKAYALDVVASLLGGKTGLWYDIVVEKEKIATGLDVGYHGFSFQTASPFTISVMLPKEGDVEKVKTRLMELLQKLINEDLNDDDVKLAKIKSTNFFDYVKDSATTYGQFVGGLLMQGFALEDIDKIRAQINAVTKEELKQVIQEIFSKNPRVISVGLPQEEGVK